VFDSMLAGVLAILLMLISYDVREMMVAGNEGRAKESFDGRGRFVVKKT